MLVFFLRNIHPILLCAIFVYLIFETQQWKRVAQETVFPVKQKKVARFYSTVWIPNSRNDIFNHKLEATESG